MLYSILSSVRLSMYIAHINIYQYKHILIAIGMPSWTMRDIALYLTDLYIKLCECCQQLEWRLDVTNARRWGVFVILDSNGCGVYLTGKRVNQQISAGQGRADREIGDLKRAGSGAIVLMDVEFTLSLAGNARTPAFQWVVLPVQGAQP